MCVTNSSSRLFKNPFRALLIVSVLFYTISTHPSSTSRGMMAAAPRVTSVLEYSSLAEELAKSGFFSLLIAFINQHLDTCSESCHSKSDFQSSNPAMIALVLIAQYPIPVSSGLIPAHLSLCSTFAISHLGSCASGQWRLPRPLGSNTYRWIDQITRLNLIFRICAPPGFENLPLDLQKFADGIIEAGGLELFAHVLRNRYALLLCFRGMGTLRLTW